MFLSFLFVVFVCGVLGCLFVCLVGWGVCLLGSLFVVCVCVCLLGCLFICLLVGVFVCLFVC